MPAPRLRFRAPIEINGINPYIRVRPEQAARLRPNWRRPMPVRIQVEGKPEVPWRINCVIGSLRQIPVTSIRDLLNAEQSATKIGWRAHGQTWV